MWLLYPAVIHVAGLGASCAEDQGPETSLVNLNAHRDTSSSGGNCTSPRHPLREWNWGATPLDLVVFSDSHPQLPDRTHQQLGEQIHPPLFHEPAEGCLHPSTCYSPSSRLPGSQGPSGGPSSEPPAKERPAGEAQLLA